MGTLAKARKAVTEDDILSRMLIRDGKDGLLLDVDGDNIADVGLFDSNTDGDIDTLAADVFNTGDFNLYIMDMDMTGVPDTIYISEKKGGRLKRIQMGAGIEARLTDAAEELCTVINQKNTIASDIFHKLQELNKLIVCTRNVVNRTR
ncbi:MAG: hypothetical protein IKS17_05575 [Firmicutes bacterium]|nr:hypothetical protein [Bacillota bacterium]